MDENQKNKIICHLICPYYLLKLVFRVSVRYNLLCIFLNPSETPFCRARPAKNRYFSWLCVDVIASQRLRSVNYLCYELTATSRSPVLVCEICNKVTSELIITCSKFVIVYYGFILAVVHSIRAASFNTEKVCALNKF